MAAKCYPLIFYCVCAKMRFVPRYSAKQYMKIYCKCKKISKFICITCNYFSNYNLILDSDPDDTGIRGKQS